MTLNQAMLIGDDIVELMEEIKETVKDRESFDDHEHQMEYMDETIQMLYRAILTKIK